MKYTTTETFGTRLIDQMAMASLQGHRVTMLYGLADHVAQLAYNDAEAMMAERQRRIDAEIGK